MNFYNFDRKIQIKDFNTLSLIAGKEPIKEINCKMASNEVFVIQLVAITDKTAKINDIRYKTDLKISCINRDIVDKFGNASVKEIELLPNMLQPLFFIIEANMTGDKRICIDFITTEGDYRIDVNVKVTDEVIPNNGYDDLASLARLKWLNSRRFATDEVTKPYTPPILDGHSVKILGRTIVFGDNGLPQQIIGNFDESINISDECYYLLAEPMQFICDDMTDIQCDLDAHNSYVEITAIGESENLRVKTIGKLNYEGFLDYKIFVTAKKDYTSEFCLKSCINNDFACYINGLGAYGGKYRDIDFSWSETKHLDCLYIGNVNLGMRLKLKAEEYKKPLINIYYLNQPLCVPHTTWANGGIGRITLNKNEKSALFSAQTGKFSLKAGETRHFDFELHITPFKPIDFKKHYCVRYSHNNKLKNELKEIDRACKKGLNNVVVHHGNAVHPFINYPFIEVERLKEMVKYAKARDIGVKVYYTVREHSNHMAEVWAYKALGNEIILRKKGNGYSWKGGTDKWLTENFGDTIIPAWKVTYKSGKYRGDNDVSFIVQPNSRLDNYYIEGLDYLVKNIGIKGIYIDDTALDRTTLERARKVLEQIDGLIDMHMWNHEEARAGDVSCMNLYTELYPFIDSLWVGEGYDYKNLSPDYLLTEVSGIPYGLTSQLLQDGGEPFIGMLFAANNRYGWGTKTAPYMYKLWDDFGILDSQMYGYWHSKNPITVDNEDVEATCYVKDNKVLVSIFNFANTSAVFKLAVDSELLGYRVKNSAVKPRIKQIQGKGLVDINRIKLAGKKGVIFILEKA